jgi:hypothetical protein
MHVEFVKEQRHKPATGGTSSSGEGYAWTSFYRLLT